MRSLTCKSHSMASKRAVKNRIKDFDVLLNEYLQSHPPKNIPKAVSVAVNLELLTTNNTEDRSEAKSVNFKALKPFSVKRSDNMYVSFTKRNEISKLRSIFSLLDRDRNNKFNRNL